MNEEIIAIKTALATLTGFVARQSPEGQLAAYLEQSAQGLSDTPGAEATTALLTQLADTARTASSL